MHVTHCPMSFDGFFQGFRSLSALLAVLTIKIATNDTLKGTSHPICKKGKEEC